MSPLYILTALFLLITLAVAPMWLASRWGCALVVVVSLLAIAGLISWASSKDSTTHAASRWADGMSHGWTYIAVTALTAGAIGALVCALGTNRRFAYGAAIADVAGLVSGVVALYSTLD